MATFKKFKSNTATFEATAVIASANRVTGVIRTDTAQLTMKSIAKRNPAQAAAQVGARIAEQTGRDVLYVALFDGDLVDAMGRIDCMEDLLRTRKAYDSKLIVDISVDTQFASPIS